MTPKNAGFFNTHPLPAFSLGFSPPPHFRPAVEKRLLEQLFTP
jgi:hypothetical protein